MNREGHDNIDLFIGQEVEHTPAYGQKTLFVVGLQDVNKILEILTNHTSQHITHVYFGANMSFPHLLVNDYRWQDWENMITQVLDAGYMCTLDINIACVEGLAESSLCENNNFIPMISAKIPYIRLLNYNATLKIDDKDFDATNPGVWCHSVHALQKRSVFTDWSKYTKDEVIR
jgi:hypothetical protein